MDQLAAASRNYLDQFGFGFVMFVNGYCAQDVLAAVTDRMHNDVETERKVRPQRAGPHQPHSSGTDAGARGRLRQLVTAPAA